MKKLNKLFLNKKLLGIVICLCILISIVGIGLFTAFSNGLISTDYLTSIKNLYVITSEEKDYNEIDGLTENNDNLINSDDVISNENVNENIPIDYEYDFPDKMMGVSLTAGVDYLISDDSSVETIKQEINKSLDEAIKLSANTVVANLCFNNTVIYSSSTFPCASVDFDILQYIVTKSKEKGLYTYIKFDLLNSISDGKIIISPNIDSDLNEIIKRNIKSLSYYDLDGIILDSYALNHSNILYSNYLLQGSNLKYEDYLEKLTSSTVENCVSFFKKEIPKFSVGLLVDSVWLNKETNEAGSNTKCDYESFVDGFSDTKKLLQNPDVDFAIVKCDYSINNKNVSFSDYVSWWSSNIPDDMPMYLLQYSSKACSNEKGWSDPSELSDQVIEAESYSNYKGSIFDSLASLLDNPKQSTDALIKYLTENIDPSFLLTQLEITKPSKNTFSTYESVVVFAGASDVNFDLSMNGEKVKRDANGAFMLTIDLEPGQNTFTFEHKDKKITYNITRNVKVLKEISPLGNVTINGGMSMTISALAYENSVVKASLNGSTISLVESNIEDDQTDLESTYRLYSGTFNMPSATISEQNLGNIKISATWSNTFSETMEGAYVTVAAKATSGSLIEIISDSAETFPIDTLNDLSDYDCYPLCKGTRDYTEGDEIIYVEGSNTYSYYILSSGQRIYTKDARVISGEITDNVISGFTVTSNPRYTYISFDMTGRIPYVAKYHSDSFTIDFCYTTEVPSNLSLKANPLFSSATWNKTKLTLNFSTTNGFLGYYAYYEDNSLTFRFNNPTGTYSLSGVPIVVDVGHSALGVGALGFLSAYGEYEINLAISKQLKSELERRGATVYMMDTVNNRPSLEDRVSYASSKNPLVFVSIHCNSSTSSSGMGTECFYFTRFSSSLSSSFASHVSDSLGTKNRGSDLARYYVTRVQEYPAILGEIGFVSNESDYYKLIQQSYQSSIAYSIADAIQNYLGTVGKHGSYVYGIQSTDNDEISYSDYNLENDDPIEEDTQEVEENEGNEENEVTNQEDNNESHDSSSKIDGESNTGTLIPLTNN